LKKSVFQLIVSRSKIKQILKEALILLRENISELIELWRRYGGGFTGRPVNKMLKIGVGYAKFVFPGRVCQERKSRHCKFIM